MGKSYTIFLARHGRAEHNFGNIFAGSKIDSPLTPAGKGDASVIADKIHSQCKCDAIFCSDMRRAYGTACFIHDHLCQEEKKKIPLRKIKSFREINIGRFAGNTREEVEEKYPKAASAFYERKITDWCFPYGENYRKAAQRAKKALKYLDEKAKDGQGILVVSHAMFLRVILHELFINNTDLWQNTSFFHDRVIKINCCEGKYSYGGEI